MSGENERMKGVRERVGGEREVEGWESADRSNEIEGEGVERAGRECVRE